MTVYVDKARNRYGRMSMCHMLADTLEELHAMAEKIGLSHTWFQSEKTPHYDICQDSRGRALKAGAVEIDRPAVAALVRHWREMDRPGVVYPPLRFLKYDSIATAPNLRRHMLIIRDGHNTPEHAVFFRIENPGNTAVDISDGQHISRMPPDTRYVYLDDIRIEVQK